MPPQYGGGIEAFILSASRRHAAMGHRVLLVDRKYSPMDPDDEEMEGVQIARLHARRWKFSLLGRLPWIGGLALLTSGAIDQLTFAFRVRNYLALKQWTGIIIVHSSVIGLVLALSNGSWKDRIIYMSHSARRFDASRSPVARLAVAFETALVRRLGRGIFSVEQARHEIIRTTGIPPSRVAIIPDNCADLEDSPRTPIQPQDVIRKYQLRGKVVILFVGRIRANKGVDVLVKAAGRIVHDYGLKATCFLLVGPIGEFSAKDYESQNRYGRTVRRLIQERGLERHVQLVGEVPVEELRELYANSNIFVLPSRFEASPKVVLEAMTFGKPVVATSVGMLPQAVQEGYNGFLIRPGDVTELADRLRYLIERPETVEKMGAAGRRKARDEFNWDKVASRMIVAFEELVVGGRTPEAR